MHLLPDLWYEKVMSQSLSLSLVEELWTLTQDTSVKEHFCSWNGASCSRSELQKLQAGDDWLSRSGWERVVLLRPALLLCLQCSVTLQTLFYYIRLLLYVAVLLMHEIKKQALTSPGLMPHFESFQWKGLSLVFTIMPCRCEFLFTHRGRRSFNPVYICLFLVHTMPRR